MTSELLGLLRVARQSAGSTTALAGVLHLSRQRTADLLSGKSKYSLNARGCLRLAIAEGVSAIDVLRMAGHDEDADLLQQLGLRGRPGKRPARPDPFIAWLVSIAPSLPKRDRALVRSFIRRLKEPPASPARPRAARKKKTP